jgi:hypothetical protein
MPFPMLALEFLDLPICLLLEGLLICGLFPSKTKTLAFIISGLIFYLLYHAFQGFYKPEPMITFLGISAALKFMYPKGDNDNISRIVALIWIASFSLLKSDLIYFFYMIYAISFIFLTLQVSQKEKIHPLKFLKVDKHSGFEVVICLSIIVLLFIFFPRYSHFFPKRNSIIQGKIGYSKTIDNSQVMSLQNSSQVAFTAETNKRIPQSKLYWRGRTHQRTDGFNWTSGEVKPVRNKIKLKNPINYTIKYEQTMGRDIILLDTPFKVTRSSLGYHKMHADNTYKFYSGDRKALLEASSSLNGFIITRSHLKNKKKYLQLPGFIPKKMKSIIDELDIKNKPLNIVLRKVKAYLIKEKFSYSLAPGDVTSLTKFLDKKIGYCSHYASFLGILLRQLGHPSRLVSGFQGGTYNNIGGFYTVRSNDAHAWVEVLDNKKWKRVDPTSFIDPARINLGGNLYFSTSANERSILNRTSTNNFLTDIQKAWGYINYRMSVLIDSYDMSQQDKLSDNLKISKKMFYIIGFIMLNLFALIYFLKPKKKFINSNKVDRSFAGILEKLEKKGLSIKNTDSLDTIREKIRKNGKFSDVVLEIIDAYEKIKYQGLDNKQTRKEYFTLSKNKNIYQ